MVENTAMIRRISWLAGEGFMVTAALPRFFEWFCHSFPSQVRELNHKVVAMMVDDG